MEEELCIQWKNNSPNPKSSLGMFNQTWVVCNITKFKVCAFKVKEFCELWALSKSQSQDLLRSIHDAYLECGQK